MTLSGPFFGSWSPLPTVGDDSHSVFLFGVSLPKKKILSN